MKNKCKRCGESIRLDKEEAKMVDNGEISPPDQCEECFQMECGNNQSDIYEFSDADPGL